METPDLSPFLYYDYLRYVVETDFKCRPKQVTVALIKKDDNVCMLIPLVQQARSPLRMLGDIQGCDIADALFAPGLSDKDKNEAAAFFLSQLKGTVSLNRLPEDSPLVTASLSLGGSVSETHVEYVRIPLEGDWEMHLKRLSKSVRQNIRTAYNRMNRDGIQWRLCVYDENTPMDDIVWKRIMDAYFGRLLAKYKRGVFSPETKGGIIIQTVKFLHFRFIKKFNIYHLKHDTFSLRKLPNAFHAVLYADDRIMAFFSGLYTHDKTRLCIPRLAFNEAFRFYSPGYILLSEVLQKFYSEGRLQVLDLCRGDEQYKFDLGGETYFTKNLTLSL